MWCIHCIGMDRFKTMKHAGRAPGAAVAAPAAFSAFFLAISDWIRCCIVFWTSSSNARVAWTVTSLYTQTASDFGSVFLICAGTPI